ncbi:hypothetical protein D3C81_1936610 [compost metagenome]
MMVVPCALSLAMGANSRAVSPGVRVAVGSSMISRRAWRDSALAISTSCFSATMSWRTLVAGARCSPTSSR